MQTLTLEVEAHIKVDDLIALISVQKSDLDIDRLSLHIGNIKLDMEKRISDYGIKNDNIL